LEKQTIALIFFFYGLAFFSMGLAILLEIGRASDERLHHALIPLAAFGFIHGLHEWIEMLEILQILPGQYSSQLIWQVIRLALLALSFLALAAFGASLLSPNARIRRISLLVPLLLAAIWGFGILAMRSNFPVSQELWDAADVWTRYSIAIPGAVVATAGLISLQRVFRRAGLAQFGRDALWAAVAFAWYGLVGQAFTRPSPLPPSNIVNQVLFFELFGFPVQLLRAAAAGVAAYFVIRFLRSFEVETQQQISALQKERLEEAQQREALRGELLKRVVAAQEAERQRVGRELHDETGQALTAIGLSLRSVSSTLTQDVDKAASRLRQLEDLAAHSLTELQRLISDLRPSHLDDLGLAAALRWYAGEVEDRAPLKVTVYVEGENSGLIPEINTGLFRVAQEALTNVVKHADADHAVVKLIFSPHCVQLEIEDDGSGFEPGLARMDASRPSWGLAGMEERTALLNGRFHLESTRGKGTRIRVMIPLNDSQEGCDEDTIDAR
jgi:signal transduction histidine kinase